MRRYKTLFFAVFFMAGTFVFAQAGVHEVETLLNTGAVTYAQAARFVLEASSAQTAFNQEEAFLYAEERGWLPKKAAADGTARLDEVSKILINAFGMKGGIMYSLTKGSKYAYRELVYKNIIQGRVVGSMPVSGEYLLFITGRMLSRTEAAQEEAERKRLDAEERAARQRREAIAAEISVMLVEQQVADTTVEATETGVTITLSNIQFLADSAILNQTERVKLQEIANILRNIPGIKLEVSGHTALAGTAENRLRISQERARAVATYLVSLGACDPANITSIGYGAARPVADNSTEQGMALNRRVEITILEN